MAHILRVFHHQRCAGTVSQLRVVGSRVHVYVHRSRHYRRRARSRGNIPRCRMFSKRSETGVNKLTEIDCGISVGWNRVYSLGREFTHLRG
jgi:hypothetical protein